MVSTNSSTSFAVTRISKIVRNAGDRASWRCQAYSAVFGLSDWGAEVIKVEGVGSGATGMALVVGVFTCETARVDADFILEVRQPWTTHYRNRH